MSTHATVTVLEDSKPLVTIYSQYDGYFEGLGEKLTNFLQDFEIVNGLPVDEGNRKLANGMGCLAAQLIAYLKTEPGSYYIVPADNKQEYMYSIFSKGEELYLTGKETDGSLEFEKKVN